MSDTRTARLAEIRARVEAAMCLVCKGTGRWEYSTVGSDGYNSTSSATCGACLGARTKIDTDIPWLLDELDAAAKREVEKERRCLDYENEIAAVCQEDYGLKETFDAMVRDIDKHIARADAAHRTALLEAAEVAENHGTQHSFESCSRIIANELRRRAEEKQP